MTLTPTQQQFLDNYVRKHSFKGKGKTKRAESFSTLRDEVNKALIRAPSDLPGYNQLIARLKSADTQAEQLKFNRAAEALKLLLKDIRLAVDGYTPPVDPLSRQAADPTELNKLQIRFDGLVNTKSWQGMKNQPGIGSDLKILQVRTGTLLGQDTVSIKEFKQAAALVNEMEVKHKYQLTHLKEIEKRRDQLRKYSSEITSDDSLYPDDALDSMINEANRLEKLPATAWTKTDETAATSAYLDMMLVLSGRDQVKQKDFKSDSKEELVLALRRKEKQKQGGNKDDLESNFKLVVKPSDREIAVEGFKPGGGAPREVLGGVIGDKLQEMLGFNLNVAPTKLVKVDGGTLPDLGNVDKTYNKGEQVTVSVQAFVRNGQTTAEIINEKIKSENRQLTSKGIDTVWAAELIDQKVDKEEIKQMAVFDLISLHCDRHAGNMMLDGDDKLAPIDHGNIMPTKAGLRARYGSLQPKTAVLATTAAADEPMSPEMMESIERLNIDELVTATRESAKSMKEVAPEVDETDLEDGLANVRRSAEFMKFAARRLTIKQIYIAYSSMQDYIFFTDETQKIEGFSKAVEAMLGRVNAEAELLQDYNIDLADYGSFNKAIQPLHQLGWLPTFSNVSVELEAVIQGNAVRLLDVIKNKLASPIKLPEKPADRLAMLGGNAAVARLGHDIEMAVNARARMLELALFVNGRMP